MGIAEKIRELLKQRKWAVFMTVCGVTGLLLIMISSLLPDKKTVSDSTSASGLSLSECDEHCSDTEKRLGEMLSCIDGAGNVRVYITFGSCERYIYASEGRRSRSEGKTEEEDKYVMIGSGSEKSPLVETIEKPEVTGAVIVCDGGDSPSVREKMYKAASAALGISTAKIYVAKLR